MSGFIKRRVMEIFLALVMIFFTNNVFARNIVFDGDDPVQELSIRVENASATDVLRSIAQKYDFEVRGLEETGSGEVFTATLTGNLDKILLHLLRNRNHLIVRSAGKPAGIERIVIYSTSEGNSVETDNTAGPFNNLPKITRPAREE